MTDSWEKIGQALVALLVFGAVIAALLGIARTVDRWPRRLREHLVVVVFAGPLLLLAGIGLVYPGVRTAVLSFFDPDGTTFVGLENYSWVFTDSAALTSLGNTVAWVLVVPAASVTVGLGYAVLVDRSRAEGLLKALLFMPQAISFVGASVIWKFVFTYRQEGLSQIGLLNQVLVWLGIPPQQFLVNSPWNTGFLMIVVIWTQAGFAMVVLSAAIKAVPGEVLEAARIDGAGSWQLLTRITVPMIRPTVVVVLTTISVAMLKLFDVVRTMTGGQYDTSVIANMMYDQSFRYSQPGRGAALAVVLLALVLPVVALNAAQLRKNREIR
ncbi:MAG TPA: sugar ABC transporter permease [Cellulomonas sp.]